MALTNLNDSPSVVYHGCYVQRGHYPERGIQELKHGLAMDRLSSHRFLANAFTRQCHVLALAIWTLFREANAQNAEIARHQLSSVRPLVFKVGALVESSVRRVCSAVNEFTHMLGRLWPLRPHRPSTWSLTSGTSPPAVASQSIK